MLKARVQNFASAVVGADTIAGLWWRLRGRPTDHVTGARRDRFSHLYDTKLWVDGRDDAPPSGYGSSLEATTSIRESLPRLLSDLGVKSLLDLGCGDFTWMREIDLPCPYIGADIVPSLVDDLSKRFGNERRLFLTVDACEDALPEADAILCREVLFHLSFKDAKALLANVRKSKARYFIATTSPGIAVNLDIPTGHFSDRNLSIAPFNLGKPDMELSDDGMGVGRILGVWKL